MEMSLHVVFPVTYGTRQACVATVAVRCYSNFFLSSYILDKIIALMCDEMKSWRPRNDCKCFYYVAFFANQNGWIFLKNSDYM